MLLRDGYTEEEIDKILKDDNIKFKETTERALCRLFTYGEGVQGQSKLYLLPWCIDKWRRYVKERKAFKYWLDYLENWNNVERSKTRKAFEKWANAIHGHKSTLRGWQYPWLQTNDYYNRRNTRDQTEHMEGKQDHIDDLKRQRTFLIQKVISAQRLALSRCNDSHV